MLRTTRGCLLSTLLLAAATGSDAIAGNDQGQGGREAHEGNQRGDGFARDHVAPTQNLDYIPIKTADGRANIDCIVVLGADAVYGVRLGGGSVKASEMRSGPGQPLALFGDAYLGPNTLFVIPRATAMAAMAGHALSASTGMFAVISGGDSACAAGKAAGGGRLPVPVAGDDSIGISSVVVANANSAFAGALSGRLRTVQPYRPIDDSFWSSTPEELVGELDRIGDSPRLWILFHGLSTQRPGAIEQPATLIVPVVPPRSQPPTAGTWFRHVGSAYVKDEGLVIVVPPTVLGGNKPSRSFMRVAEPIIPPKEGRIEHPGCPGGKPKPEPPSAESEGAKATTRDVVTIEFFEVRSAVNKAYLNPLERPAPPVEDTEAFATCP